MEGKTPSPSPSLTLHPFCTQTPPTFATKDMSINSKWAPLEANPEVLTLWAGRVGLSTKLTQFSDVYGLDDELLALVPQPVKAVLLIFPITAETEASRKKTDEQIAENGQPNLDPTLFFVKQTISNACGTIALLHSIYNTDVTIKPDSPLQKFQLQAIELNPDERAKLLETTDLFATAHATAASQGQSSLPPNLDTNQHFVAFVQAPDQGDGDEVDGDGMRLVEVDGRRPHPVDHGPSTDLLKDAAKLIKEKYIDTTDSLNFTIITMGPPQAD
ncbi:ubiquitinyl hydrolase 1 [Serendipita sp. 405]|nr:ubiquitinyl hydrolase 1 [Serendipita sp. 405]